MNKKIVMTKIKANHYTDIECRVQELCLGENKTIDEACELIQVTRIFVIDVLSRSLNDIVIRMEYNLPAFQYSGVEPDAILPEQWASCYEKKDVRVESPKAHELLENEQRGGKTIRDCYAFI